jgi:hypothetical protein
VPNTPEPETITFAPAAHASATLSTLMPPSTSISTSSPRSSIIRRSRRILSSAAGMKRWPPNPGLTDITSTIATSGSTYSIASGGVCGFSTTTGRLPSSRI